jgi:hypothetical protein
MTEQQIADPFAIPPPDGDESSLAHWEEAEFQCQGFPRRYLEKCRELREALEGHKSYAGMLDDLERQVGFVIRNLLDVLENCRPEPEEPLPPASQKCPDAPYAPPAMAVAPVEEQAAADALAQAASADAGRPRRQLDSVRRSIEYVLEQLGVRKVDLLGQTYDGIVVEGRKVFDPFEVLSSTQSGKAAQRVVSRVVSDLWVDRDGRVVKKGLVIC